MHSPEVCLEREGCCDASHAAAQQMRAPFLGADGVQCACGLQGHRSELSPSHSTAQRCRLSSAMSFDSSQPNSQSETGEGTQNPAMEAVLKLQSCSRDVHCLHVDLNMTRAMALPGAGFPSCDVFRFKAEGKPQTTAALTQHYSSPCSSNGCPRFPAADWEGALHTHHHMQQWSQITKPTVSMDGNAGSPSQEELQTSKD